MGCVIEHEKMIDQNTHGKVEKEMIPELSWGLNRRGERSYSRKLEARDEEDKDKARY